MTKLWAFALFCHSVALLSQANESAVRELKEDHLPSYLKNRESHDGDSKSTKSDKKDEKSNGHNKESEKSKSDGKDKKSKSDGKDKKSIGNEHSSSSVTVTVDYKLSPDKTCTGTAYTDVKG